MGQVIGFLLGINRVILEDGSRWAFSFATPWSVVWFVLAGVVIAAGVTALYWRESVPLSFGQRLFFVSMRMLVVVTVLLMLAEPSIFVSTEREGRAVVAVMLDVSESMSIPDAHQDEELERRAARAAGLVAADAPADVALTEEQRARLREMQRLDLVRAALNDRQVRLIERLAEVYEVALYTYDAEARRLTAEVAPAAPAEAPQTEPLWLAGDTLTATGKSTDIGSAVRTAIKDARTRRRTLAGVVLLTDGRVTGGGETVSALARYARERGVPVYPVAVGDPHEPRDVRVTALLVNSTVFVDDPTQVSFVIESTGFEGQRVRVELLRDDQLITGKDVTLLGFGRQQRETFTFKPTTEGKHTYTVQVRPLPDELITANNAAKALVTVLKGKIKVLFVEGLPRWEYRFLKTALVRDEGLLVSCLLSSAEFDFIQEGNLPIDHFPSKREDLFGYHVIILGDVDPTIFTETQIELIKEFVERLGGGIAFVAGERFMPAAFRRTELGKVIPVEYAAVRQLGANLAEKGLTRAFRPVLTEDGKQHPVTLLADTPEENEAVWRKLPGMFWHFPARRVKPGATPLLVHPTERGEGEPRPLAVTSFYGAGRTLFLGIDSTWRWRYGVEDLYFYRFWGQVIRYLNAGRQADLGQRFSITTYKPDYTVGEPIMIRARVLDRAYQPAQLQSAEAAVIQPDNLELRVALKPTEPGIFEGQTRALVPGTHDLRLTSPRPELEGEKAAYAFLVKRPDIEFRDTRTDQAALVNLAQTSGGRFYHLDELKRLAEDLRAQRRIRVDRAQFPLWDAPIFFLVFFLAICAEWLYRKRQRLL